VLKEQVWDDLYYQAPKKFLLEEISTLKVLIENQN